MRVTHLILLLVRKLGAALRFALLQNQLNPEEKFEFPNLRITWRKSESVDFDEDIDEKAIAEQYPEFLRSVKYNLDKTIIKKFIKDSEVQIKGIKLIKKDNIQIK